MLGPGRNRFAGHDNEGRLNLTITSAANNAAPLRHYTPSCQVVPSIPMISLKKLLSIIALSVFVTGCGIIDTEQAGEALALKEQVLRLQIEELDPLMDQLDDMQSQIAPLEEEIENLEAAREDIYNEARDIGDDFEREMGGAYEILWQGEEEARDDFEDQLEEQYQALEREWDGLESGQQEVWRTLEDDRDDMWDEFEDTQRAMWLDFEDETYEKRQVIEEGDPEIVALIESLEDRRDLVQADESALNVLQMGIRKQEQELEMRRFDIEDQLDPLYERLETMHNESNQIWEQEPPYDFEQERNSKYELIRDKQQQIEAAWDDQQGQNEIDFTGRSERRGEAQNAHRQILDSINTQRGEAYDQDEQAETGENADADIARVDQNYNEAKSVYRGLLAGTESLISQLSAAQSSDGGSVDTSAIVAGLDSSRFDLSSAQDELAGAEETIPGGEESNSLYPAAAQAKTDAEAALAAANVLLADANDLVIDEAIEVDRIFKAAAVAEGQAAVDSAQSQFDAATTALDNTPERISTSGGPNPGYAEIQSRISGYEALIANYEAQLADAEQGGESTAADPELTTAYASKAEYEAILRDLESTYETDIAALRAKVDAGSGTSVDVGSLEQEFEAQIQRANLELEEKLKVIDSEEYGGNTKSDAISNLENESAALEQEARAIEQEQQVWQRAREEQQKVKRAQIRALEEQIDPIRENQKELDRSQRPLRKESMIIETQRMTIQEQRQVIENELDPLWDIGEEAKEELWEEFENSQRGDRRALEEEIDDLRDGIEDLMDDKQREAEDAMNALRQGLEERMRGLEDQRDEFDDAFDEEIEQKQAELDDLIEVLREESMQPLEEKSVALDEEIEVRWLALEVLYEEQGGLTDQMKDLEVRIRDLDRQAEFGVLNVLTGALENVAELEKSGGVGSFDSFIPGAGAIPGIPDVGDLVPSN